MINLSINNLKSDIVGDVLPNIFFNKISLDTKNQPIPESNPHIDSDREVILLQTAKNKRIFHNGFNTNKNNLESKNLTTKINLTIFNSIDKATDDSWFKNVDVLDYVYIRLLQSTSENFTNNFIDSNYPTDIANLTDSKKVKIKIIPLKELVNEISTDTSTDTKLLTEIHYSTEFTIKGLNQEHLTLFATSYLDLQEFANKFQLNLPNNLEFKGQTTVEKVIVSNKTNANSHIYSTSNGSVYTGKVQKVNGNVYTSDPVSPLLLTKINVTNLKIKDKRKIENTFNLKTNFKNLFKKQNLKEINKTELVSDLYVSRNNVNVLTSYMFVDFLEAAKQNVKYKFLFENKNELILSEAINYIKLKKLTLFRKRVFDNASFFNKEENKILINTTEDKNGIVKNTLSFYTKYKNFVMFDNNQIKSKNFGSLLPSSETLDSLFKVAEVKEVLFKNTEYLRSFIFTDYEMSKLTDGKYQYTVELDIEDSTREFLINYYNKLLNSKKELINYYQKISTNYNVKTDTLTKNYIQELINLYPTTGIADISVRNTITAPWISVPSLLYTSTEILENKESSDYEVENVYKMLHPSSTSPDEINDVIKMLEDSLTRFEQILDIRNDSNQKNVQNFKNNSVTISKTFKNIFDSNEKKNVAMDFIGFGLEDSKINLSTLFNRVQVEKKKYFNSETLQPDLELSQSLNNPQVYNDLFDIETTSTSFLTPAVIRTQVNTFNLLNNGEEAWNPQQYNLVNSQVLNNKINRNKPFVSKSPNFSSTLSNSLINDIGITIEDQKQNLILNKNELQVNLSNKDVSSWLGSSTPLKNSNLSVKDEVCEDVKEKTDFTLDISEIDTVLKSLESPTQLLSRNQYTIKNFDIKSNASITSKFVNKKFNLSNQTNTINNKDVQFLQNKAKAITSKVNVGNVERVNVQRSLTQNNIISQNNNTPQQSIVRNNTFTTSYTKAMPIQIKALMLGSNKSVKKNFFELGFDPLVHPETKNIIKYNFQTIVKLEYLSGFEISNNKLNLNKPIWSLLTKNIFNSFDGQILIRQIKFEDKTIDFVNTEDDINIVNKYFILDSEKTDTTTLNLVQNVIEAQSPALVVNKNVITNGAITQVINGLNLARTSENQIKKNLLIKNVSDISVEPKFIRTVEV